MFNVVSPLPVCEGQRRDKLGGTRAVSGPGIISGPSGCSERGEVGSPSSSSRLALCEVTEFRGAALSPQSLFLGPILSVPRVFCFIHIL